VVDKESNNLTGERAENGIGSMWGGRAASRCKRKKTIIVCHPQFGWAAGYKEKRLAASHSNRFRCIQGIQGKKKKSRLLITQKR